MAMTSFYSETGHKFSIETSYDSMWDMAQVVLVDHDGTNLTGNGPFNSNRIKLSYGNGTEYDNRREAIEELKSKVRDALGGIHDGPIPAHWR